jgi:urease subunit gamma/beta
MGWGSTLLNTDDVLPGVAPMMPILTVEGLFPDGSKMITVHDPIRPGREPLAEAPRPGEVIAAEGVIDVNAGRPRATVTVLNTADRPVQVGSHVHFFEANAALDFDRALAFGMRLDVPAGVSARFEPGESKEVALVALGGTGVVTGLNSLTEGDVRDPEVRAEALRRARERGFKGA